MSDVINNHDSLADRSLLAFSGQTAEPLLGPWANIKPYGQKRVDVTFEDATRGVLITGASGTGKTVGVIEPALKGLLDAGCSGVVLTTKDADLGLIEDFPDQTVVLGASQMATPVNLIGGMSLQTIKAFLDGLRLSANGSRDAYWGSRSTVYAQFVVETLRLMGRNPTLASIYEALSEPTWFVELFDAWICHQPGLSREYRALLDGILKDPFSILVMGGSRHLAEMQDPRDDAAKQYGWHTMHLLPLIQPFSADSRLREGLCNSEASPLDMQDLIYEQRKTILTDIPEHVFGPAGRLVNEVLRVAMRNAVLSYDRHREQGYGRDRFTFMVIDEFQHHVCFNQDAAMQGLFDDNSWFDRSREYGHINVVATQGISSLAAKVPEGEPPAVMRSLLQNISTTIGFATHDPDTLEHLERHLMGADQQAIRDIVTSHLERGQAVVVAHYLSRHGGSAAAHIGCGPINGVPAMTYGRERGERSIMPGRFGVAEPEQRENPLAQARAMHDSWIQWFDTHRNLLRQAILDVRKGRITGLNVPSDPLHRRTWVCRDLDDEGNIRFGFERYGSSEGWGLRISLPRLFELIEQAENIEHLDRASSKVRPGGWRILPQFQGYFRVEHDVGARLSISQHDWGWVCEVADQWGCIMDDVQYFHYDGPEDFDEIWENRR